MSIFIMNIAKSNDKQSSVNNLDIDLRALAKLVAEIRSGNSKSLFRNNRASGVKCYGIRS